MKASTSSFVALAFLLALVVGCGGSGSDGGDSSGGGSCGSPAGDPNLVARWTFDVGVHPVEEITLNADGSFSGELTSGCMVSGNWSANGSSLTLCVGSASSTCVSLDVASGDVSVLGYVINGNYLTIADEDGTTDLERD